MIIGGLSWWSITQEPLVFLYARVRGQIVGCLVGSKAAGGKKRVLGDKLAGADSRNIGIDVNDCQMRMPRWVRFDSLKADLIH